MGNTVLIPAATLTQPVTVATVPRTLAEIEGSLTAARQGSVELSAQLTSPSTTAIYRLIERVVAAAIWVFEGMLTRFQADITDLVHGAPVGTLKWYADRALEFQAGDDLQIINNRIQYAQYDAIKRIIRQASASEQGNRVLLKAAKAGPNDQGLQPLSDAEYDQVMSYFDRLRPAGIAFELRSLQPDRLRVKANIYINPLLTKASVKTAVEAAITAFLTALPFDGVLLFSRLEDAIQAVAGVVDVQLVEVEGQAATPTGTQQSSSPTVARSYLPEAGYLVPDDRTGRKFSDTITYYAQNGTTPLV